MTISTSLRVNTRRLDRPTHNLFAQRLLSSGARTADGDAADWFYVPIRCRGHSDGDIVARAIEYIRKTYPWWDRFGGGRHFFIHTADLGVEDTGKWAGENLFQITPNATWLTHCEYGKVSREASRFETIVSSQL